MTFTKTKTRAWASNATPAGKLEDEAIQAARPGPPKGKVLAEFFSQLEQQGIVFAILRNYEGLPEKPGRDIDLLTADFAALKKVILQVFPGAGFRVRIFRRYDSLVKFQLLRWGPEGLEVVEIDGIWAIRWRGIPLVPQDILQDRQLAKNCIYTLPPGTEAAISLIKHLIYQRSVQERYQPVLPGMAQKDPEGFQKALEQCFGDQLATKLWELTCQGAWQRLAALVPQLRKTAILRALKHNPVGQFQLWAGFLWWNFWKFFRPRGLFVVLIGPDGSGKSTIASNLEAYLRPLFQGTKYFHFNFGILPRLRDLMRHLGVEVPEEAPAAAPGQAVRVGTVRSLVYLAYYSLDFLMGHLAVFRARGHGQFVIFDRYIYDYLIQQSMSLPEGLMGMVLRLLPRPDAVVYLRNRPEVIFARKPELSLEELERQGMICSRLISQLPHGYVVDTTGTPAEITIQIARILVDRLVPGSFAANHWTQG
jgi:thymidylate kinase